MQESMSLRYEPVSVEIESCTDLVQVSIAVHVGAAGGRVAWFGDASGDAGQVPPSPSLYPPLFPPAPRLSLSLALAFSRSLSRALSLPLSLPLSLSLSLSLSLGVAEFDDATGDAGHVGLPQ